MKNAKFVNAVFNAEDLEFLSAAVNTSSPDSDEGREEKSYLQKYLAELLALAK